MALKSQDRKLSFDILAAISQYDDDDMSTTTSNSLIRSKSDPPSLQNDAAATASDSSPTRKKKKKKKKNKKGRSITHDFDMIPEDIVLDDHNECINNKNSVINGEVANYRSSSSVTSSCEVVAVSPSSREVVDCVSGTGTASLTTTTPPPPHQFGELRQRTNVNATTNGGGNVEMVVLTEERGGSGNSGRIVDDCAKEEVVENVGKENGSELKGRKLEREQTLDWKELVVEDPNYTLPIEKSPMKYFLEEMYAGNSLRSTTTLANEKERERVYDTIFHLPWRCELLINIGLFVCFDSFLSLLTIMPTRIIITFWRCLKTRQFKRPSSSELADFGCFVVLISGVTLLQQADISLIYHMIRGQGIIKLYVVYNVLEVFDKLCQSFGGDVIQALFSSADGLANCSPENMQFWLWRFILDEALAVASSIIHSFILLAQAITLSTCIVAHNNALFAMLVSNNFAEIKSNVFKRYSKDNVHSLVYFDSVERFHISAFVLFVLAQNILEAEGPWFESFLCNALVVYICEVMIDIIKHSFIAKFNNIKPIAFSEFLEDLCKQTLNIQTENGKNNLTFVPLAPACVVIRVLRPVYAAHLPSNPLPWRLFWIIVLFAMTFIMLASLKVLMGMGLRQHARWYLKRCERRKLHSD